MTVGTALAIDSRWSQVDRFDGGDQDLVQRADVANHRVTCARDADAFELSCQDLWVTIVDRRRAVHVGQ